MDQAVTAGLARHVAQVVGGALMAYGWVDETGVALLTGAAVSLAALGSYLCSRRARGEPSRRA
jgi:hypothetical protein